MSSDGKSNGSASSVDIEQSVSREIRKDMPDSAVENTDGTRIWKDQSDTVVSADTERCSFFHFDGCRPAKGWALLAMGRGSVIMSNIFLTTSFLYLANQDAGCLDDNDETIDNCTNKVYGFAPASLMTNTVVITGLLSAFFMPVIGAIVDFTPHRKNVGIASCIVMGVIQAVQVGTTAGTWFPMLILQAIAGFVYQVLVVAAYAYLPEISALVGQERMAPYSARFTISQFSAQASYLVFIIAVSTALGLSDVVTGQASQAINTVWLAAFFYFGWNCMPNPPANNTLPEGASILSEGFYQNWRTIKNIQQNYKKGLRWYFLAVVFAEASAAAITSVAVVFLDETLGMGSAEIGIFFLVTLVCTVPGAWLGQTVTLRTTPIVSWMIDNMLLLVTLIVGALVYTDEEQASFSYVWGAVIGVELGWFYSTENLTFSMCLPKGQEAELSGFFVYSTQILGWLPPLLFTVLVESGFEHKWGVIVTSFGFLAATAMLSCTATWNEVLLDSGRRVSELPQSEDALPSGTE